MSEDFVKIADTKDIQPSQMKEVQVAGENICVVNIEEKYYAIGSICTHEGGPLAEGGADVVIIDDPQMPGLIPLIRKTRPNLPIIYRSHIEIRSDLVDRPDSAQKEVWDWQVWMAKLGPKYTGNPAHTTFVEFLASHLKDSGLVVAREHYTLPRWDARRHSDEQRNCFTSGALAPRCTYRFR